MPNNGGPSDLDLKRLVKAASMKADKRMKLVTNNQATNGKGDPRRDNDRSKGGKGFAAKAISTAASEAKEEEKEIKAAQKRRYRELVQIAKKSPQLIKVVGAGEDAKMPKQNNFPGSSPRK